MPLDLDKTIVVSLISAIFSILTVLIIKPFVDKRLLRFQLKLNYNSEQSKKIKDILSVYKGRLLKSAELLNNRLKNYAKNHEKNWLVVNGDYISEHHYLDSIVYRFLSFFAHIKIIESKLIYLDTTISQKSDLRLIKYFRVLHDVMCDVDLYDGFVYDNSHATEHFYSNLFDNYSNSFIEQDEVISFDKFLEKKPTILNDIKSIYVFFDGIKPNPMMLRCERLKVFHILLMSFLNEYGYDFQKTTDKKLTYLKGQLGIYRLTNNLKKLTSKYKLNKWFNPINKIIDALK